MFPQKMPPFDPEMDPHKLPNFKMPEADVSSVLRKWLDIPYALKSPAQKLDIFLPDEGEGPFPVVLHIHGGGFELGDKRDSHFAAYLRGLQRGYAVITINYRLSSEAIFPAGLQDVKAAIRWVRANGRKYHLDGSRIAACGGSAGGNLAAMVCLTANEKALEDSDLGNMNFPCDVQAGVDMFGPTDFLKMDEQMAQNGLGIFNHNDVHSPESHYLGTPIQKVPERARQANPITYIQKNMPHILIQHGAKDHLVPVQQSLVFVEALKEKGCQDRFEFDLFETADHADPQFETEQNMNRVFDFLDHYLKAKEF